MTCIRNKLVDRLIRRSIDLYIYIYRPRRWFIHGLISTFREWLTIWYIVRCDDSGHAERVRTESHSLERCRWKGFSQHRVSGDVEDKNLKLEWQFYFYWLRNSVPIHPACPESPCLTVFLLITGLISQSNNTMIMELIVLGIISMIKE